MGRIAQTVKKFIESGGQSVIDVVSEFTGAPSSAPQQSSGTAPEATQQRTESVDQAPTAQSMGMSDTDFAERSRRLREGLLRGESLFSRLGSSQRNRGTRQTLG